MKKIIILLPLLFFLYSCTEKPEEPKEPASPSYTITLSPSTATAYINVDDVLTASEVVAITVTIKKNNMVYTTPVQVTFQTQGASFVETMTNSYLATSAQGKATATLYATVQGVYKVSVFVKPDDSNKTISATGEYTFMVDPDLKITGVTPNTSSSLGGEQITITGNGFVFPLEVYIGENKATYISNTYNEILVQSPKHTASCCGCNDIVDVKVVINPKEATEKSYTLNKSFTYIFEPAKPIITGVDPNHGTNDGGTLVTIYGGDFYCSEGILVYFNTAPARVVECYINKIVVQAPPAYDAGVQNCSQEVSIRVLNVCGGLDATITGAFKYGPDMKIYAVEPGVGLAGGGDTVTIYGQGFSCPVAVTFAGVGADVISCSNNQIVVRTGGILEANCTNKSGSVVVTDLDCGISATCNNCWTYLAPKLEISGISPTSGDYGDAITIYGYGFYPPFRILFGEANSLGYTYVDDTQITNVLVPPFSGNYDTQNCTDAFGCNGTRNINTPVDLSVKSLNTGCENTFKSFYYEPPDTTCRAPLPTCSITTSVNNCNVTYTANNVCGGSYTWNFGAYPCVPTGNILTCTFASTGTYTVSVDITNTGGTASCSQAATVTTCP
ncbi:MAG: IPT/TIG domain-containing protein [Thermoanaerobaculia bacterium]